MGGTSSPSNVPVPPDEVYGWIHGGISESDECDIGEETVSNHRDEFKEKRIIPRFEELYAMSLC